MKKYLLALCMTMFAFVSSWAQSGHTSWAIEAPSTPIYVEVSGGSVGTTSGNPNVLRFKVITPTIDGSGNPVTKIFDTDFTVEAVEVAPDGVTPNTIAIASEVTKSGDEYSVTFSPKTYKSTGVPGSLGITKFYLVVKDKTNPSTVYSSTAATPFEVNVFDRTLARYLINPGNQIVDKGKTNEILISLAPVSAGVTVSLSDNHGNISIDTSNPFKTPTTEDITNNIVRLKVDASSAAKGDHVKVKITPNGKPKDRYGNDIPAIEFTVTVDLPELPVKNMINTYREFDVGVDFGTPLKTEDFPADATYTVKYKYIPVAGYRDDVVTISPDDSQSAILRTQHAGMAQVKATFTPTGTTANSYRTWERILNVMVLPTHMKLTVEGVEGTNNNWTLINTPTLSYDPEIAADVHPEYTINYTLEGALPNTAHIAQDATCPGGIKVVIDNAGPTQRFFLVVTVTPTGDNANDYVGDVQRIPILVGGTETGAYLRKQTADGKSWVAYLSSPEQTGSYIVAKFNVSSQVAGDESTSAQLLQQFKDATDIKVYGNINSFNIAQLVHAMGADQQATVAEADLKTLDMSGCYMNGPLEFSHTNQGTGDLVPTFSFPIQGKRVYVDSEGKVITTEGETSGTYDDSRNGKWLTLKNVKSFTFPKPDPAYTTLPTDVSAFFGNQYNPADNNLTSLTIPEGWKVVPDGFSGKISTNRYRTSAFSKLTNLKLANSIEKIGPYAFADLKAVVLTMPYNIDRIGKSAFSTSLKLQDVYFTGPAPRYVDTQAFSGETQMCNNTVKDQEMQGQIDPATARFNYYDGSGENMVLACLLHFPEQYRAQYTDVTRVYKRLTAEEAAAHGWDQKYSKGYKVFTPEGWTSSFLADVRSKKIDPNAYVSSTVDYGMKDAFYGTDMIWPSQSQMSTGFAIAQAGYRWSGQPLGTDQYQSGAAYEDINNSIDRRGLYQFIIALANADIDITFEEGLWYTIALPFDMKPADIKKVFGPETQVCRFSKVTRVTTEGHKQIKLEFRKSTMGESWITSGSEYDGRHYAAELQEAEGNYEGIRHHHAYMIRPKGEKNTNYVTHELVDGKSVWHFKGLDFERISGTLVPDVLTPVGQSSPQYSFSPILSASKIKPYSYALVNKDGKHQFAFYKGVKTLDEHGQPKTNEAGDYVYEAGGKASQNTSYVMCDLTGTMVTPGQNPVWKDWGYEDYKEFFKKSSTGAKVYTFYADDYDDAPTAVEEVVIECGQDHVDNGKIYTINGQLVSGSHLPAGIYIKNGKKILVK